MSSKMKTGKKRKKMVKKNKNCSEVKSHSVTFYMTSSSCQLNAVLGHIRTAIMHMIFSYIVINSLIKTNLVRYSAYVNRYLKYILLEKLDKIFKL